MPYHLRVNTTSFLPGSVVAVEAIDWVALDLRYPQDVFAALKLGYGKQIVFRGEILCIPIPGKARVSWQTVLKYLNAESSRLAKAHTYYIDPKDLNFASRYQALHVILREPLEILSAIKTDRVLCLRILGKQLCAVFETEEQLANFSQELTVNRQKLQVENQKYYEHVDLRLFRDFKPSRK